MAEKWITYFRTHHSTGNEVTMVRLQGEKIPHQSSWQHRPATEQEIGTERAKRAKQDRDQAILVAFQSRPEYIAASEIRNRLEFITPDNHPLDKLSPDEWEQLRKKLC